MMETRREISPTKRKSTGHSFPPRPISNRVAPTHRLPSVYVMHIRLDLNFSHFAPFLFAIGGSATVLGIAPDQPKLRLNRRRLFLNDFYIGLRTPSDPTSWFQQLLECINRPPTFQHPSNIRRQRPSAQHAAFFPHRGDGISLQQL